MNATSNISEYSIAVFLDGRGIEKEEGITQDGIQVKK
jgi:hypothetical protein